MKKKLTFTVSLELTENVPASWVREYVKDAVESWRGSLRPPGSYSETDKGDPMWHLDPDTVKVAYGRRRT